MIINTEQNLLPNIVEYLKNIESNFLFHNIYHLKHPLAIYNNSFGKIENDLCDFFLTYKTLTVDDFVSGNKNSDEKTKILLKQYKLFLYSLREHLDDCFHIVKALIPPEEYFKDNRNQYDWLKNNFPSGPVANFLKNIDDYKKFLDRIVNELKHNNGILEWLVFYDEKTREFSMGYYVANVVDGRFEPIERIHQKFRGQHTAFSFGRDIRFNIYQMFYMSEEIIRLINDLKIPIGSVAENDKAETAKRHSPYKDILALPRHFFPDEQIKEVPSVVIKSDERLKLEFPSRLSIKPLYHGGAVLSMSGDGVTKAFALLYHLGPNET